MKYLLFAVYMSVGTPYYLADLAPWVFVLTCFSISAWCGREACHEVLNMWKGEPR